MWMAEAGDEQGVIRLPLTHRDQQRIPLPLSALRAIWATSRDGNALITLLTYEGYHRKTNGPRAVKHTSKGLSMHPLVETAEHHTTNTGENSSSCSFVVV